MATVCKWTSEWPSVQEVYLDAKLEETCLVENGFDVRPVENIVDNCLVENSFDTRPVEKGVENGVDNCLVETCFDEHVPDKDEFVPTLPDRPQPNVIVACNTGIDASIDIKSVEVAGSMEDWVSVECLQAAKYEAVY